MNEKKEKDIKKVQDLFEAIGVEKSAFLNVFRRTTRNKDKPALIVVNLRYSEDRNIILKAAKQLKEINNYRNVFINPNLTVAQQNLAKKLRDIRREENAKLSKDSDHYFGIRNDRVVKIYKKN